MFQLYSCFTHTPKKKKIGTIFNTYTLLLFFLKKRSGTYGEKNTLWKEWYFYQEKQIGRNVIFSIKKKNMAVFLT